MYEEALDRNVCRSRFGRDYGPVIRQDYSMSIQFTNVAEGRIIQPGARGLDTHVIHELHGYRYDNFRVRTAERRTICA